MIGSCEFLKLFEDLVFMGKVPCKNSVALGKEPGSQFFHLQEMSQCRTANNARIPKASGFGAGRHEARIKEETIRHCMTWGNDGPEPPGLWIGAWRPIWRRKSARWIACETGNHAGLAYIHSTEPLVFIRWRTKKKSGHVDSTGLVDEFKCV